MSRDDALKDAPADPLGRRWATARRSGRLYLTWRDPDGRGGVQQVQRHYGARQFRQVDPPEGLSWRPVRDVWSDLPGTPAGDSG